MVRTLDQVQGLVALHRQRMQAMSAVTNANAGFTERRRLSYQRLYHDRVRRMGPPPTGTTEVGSILNFSREELVALGVTFSTRPSTLQLDRTMSRYWSQIGAAAASSPQGEFTLVLQWSLVNSFATTSSSGVTWAQAPVAWRKHGLTSLLQTDQRQYNIRLKKLTFHLLISFPLGPCRDPSNIFIWSRLSVASLTLSMPAASPPWTFC